MENEICLKRDDSGRSWRLDAFAKSHFIISGIGIGVGLVLFALSTLFSHFVVSALAEVVLLAFYAVAGFWHARTKQWGFPDFKEGLLAFLDPALIAWGWAALVLASLFLNVWPLLMILFLASMVLAFPSFLMVLMTMVSGALVGWYGFVVVAILAGGIPPLLFFLGSLCGSRKRSKMDEEEQQIEQECDTDV